MSELTVRDYSNLTSLNGLSDQQIEAHLGLYAGYVAKTNEILGKLESVELESANQTFSDLRELKVELSFALNGVKLHEFYFENLTADQTDPGEKTKMLIEKNFGTWENFLADLKATGLAARGWVVTMHDPRTDRVINTVADAHNVFALVAVHPLLVLDVYEHAYMLDYSTKRADYLQAFVNLINWDAVEERILKMQK